jgi:PncC family amidohydrolase
VAESCTGGMLGSLITDVPGSSAWFKGGWIVYSNELKEGELGVRHETLVAHGAVSREVVEELARGARKKAGSTLGIAITGVAGPDGGSEAKPVGTVHIGVAGPGEQFSHKLLSWPGARDLVRRLSAFWAMSLAMAALAEGEVKPGS